MDVWVYVPTLYIMFFLIPLLMLFCILLGVVVADNFGFIVQSKDE